jgi:hypothetical protein
MQQLREHEEALLAALPPAARSVYEQQQTQLRIEAAQQQRARLAHTLQHGLRVIIDCSYEQQQQHHQQPQPAGGERQRPSSMHGSTTAHAESPCGPQPPQQRRRPAATKAVRSLAKQIEVAVALNKR